VRHAWLAALVAAAPLQAAAPQGPTSVQTEFRVFNGDEEVTAATRLRVLPAGRRNAPAVDVERGEAPLAPGVYDLQAIRTSDSGVRSIKWAERLSVLHYPDEGRGAGQRRRRAGGGVGGSAGTAGRPAASQAPAIIAATAAIDSLRRRSSTGRLDLKNAAKYASS